METSQILSSINEEDDSSLLLLQEEEEFTINLTSTTLDLACSPLLVPPNSNPHDFTKLTEPCHQEKIIEENMSEQTLSARKATDDSIQQKRRKKRGNFNLRKSLAWNNAFFTEEGVLNQQELAILSGSHNKLSNMFLPGIPEEGTNTLQEDPVSRGSGLQDLKGKFSYTSPLRTVNKDVRFSGHSSPKVNSALGSNSKTPRKLELVKGVNKTLFKAGGCPRPSGAASQKRLPSMNLRDVPKKDMKIPKFSVSRPEQSSGLAMPKTSALAEKNANNNLNQPVGPAGGLRKNAAFSNTSRTTSSCKSLTTKSSVHRSRENTAGKATTGLKVLSDSVRTADASTSKVATPIPQNTQYSYGKATDPQIYTTKPSGLRMPSPSLRYFAQTQASTCPSVSTARKTQSCNFRGVGIPSLRKYGDPYHDDQMKPVHEPAASLKMPERGISSMKSMSSTTAITMSRPSVKLNKGHQRTVECSQAPDHVNSKIEFYAVSGAENSLEHQQGETQDVMESIINSDARKVVSSELPQSEEQIENQNVISLEVEKVQHKDNHISIAATTVSYPSLKLNRELEVTAIESLQVSHLVDLETHTFADSGANNMLEHQNMKEEQEELKNMGDSYNKRAVCSELPLQAEKQLEHKSCSPHETGNIQQEHLILTATITTIHPSAKLTKDFEESAMEALQASHLGKCEMESSAVGKADNSNEHQKPKEAQEDLKSIVDIDNRKALNSDLSLSKVEVEHKKLSSHEGEKIQLQGKYILQENSNRLIESKTSEQFVKNEELRSSRGHKTKNTILFKDNESYHFPRTNTSDSELKCELENSLQSCYPEQLQKVDCHENSIDVRPGNEELHASELEISRVLPLVNSEMQEKSVQRYFLEQLQKVDGCENSIDVRPENEELHANELEISRVLPLVNSEMQEKSEQRCFLEQLQKVDRRENLIDVCPGNEELHASELEISRVSPLVNSEMQENSVQSCFTEQMQKVHRCENSIDVCSGNEELNAGELEISRVLPLVNSEMQSYIVSGADYLVEHKNGEELRKSLRAGSSVADIDNRKSMVYNDHLGEQEELKIHIHASVQFEENHISQENNDGFIESDNTIEKSLQDYDFVNNSGKETKNNISSKNSQITELYHNEAFDTEPELPLEDTEVLPLKRKSLDDCKQNALTLNHKLNAVPFSDEWLAALEEVGEEILTMKTGAVQNSPPDKSLPEPGPWSPVKRKKNVEIGPFDCTKCTNVLPQRE